MDALSNHPPLADRLPIAHEALLTEIFTALDGLIAPTITSDEDVAAAREVVKPLKALQAKVEATRKTEKAPILADGNTVEEFFSGIRVDLDKMVVAITANATTYQTLKREAALKLEAARARIAAAVGEQAPAPVAAKETTRVVAASGSVAASGRVTWDYEITAAADLPRELLMPNRDAIKAKIAGLKAQGLKIEEAKIEGLRIFEKVGTTWR